MFYALEWQLELTAYQVNLTSKTSKGLAHSANYTAKAIFSSTIKYLQFPDAIRNHILKILVEDKVNKTQILQSLEEN